MVILKNMLSPVFLSKMIFDNIQSQLKYNEGFNTFMFPRPCSFLILPPDDLVDVMLKWERKLK